MFIALNILLIVMVLLIAYWWANQGLFSAILHLICVVAAGAIALAVWEPLTVGLLLRGNFFDDYAWGVSLISVFAVLLLVLRVSMDKLVPNNVDVPRWANLSFGFPVGAAAGVLTMGIVIIGLGFIQSTNAIMDFQGKARGRGGKIEAEQTLWAPVHTWTYQFYGFLSAGSLYPTFNNSPLLHYYPDLDSQAASLIRDSAAKGRAKLSLRPSEAKIQELLYDEAAGKYLVKVRFEAGARDFGEQLTLSSAQIRLIGTASGFNEPKVVHPDQWTQYDGWHRFDDVSHYITSEPGQMQAEVVIEFPARELGNVAPKFIQIRGTRFRLPAPQAASAAIVRAGGVSTGKTETIDQSAPNIQSAIEQSNSIRPIQVSTNQKPAGIDVTDDRFIAGGQGEFPASGADRPSRNLAIQGIFEPAGTRIVQVDVSRESPANIFGSVRESVEPNATIKLVDSGGRAYLPIGLMHHKPDNRILVRVDFQQFFSTFGHIPALPTAGGQRLLLMFNVTEGVTITGFKVGDVTVGTCNLQVRDPKAR